MLNLEVTNIDAATRRPIATLWHCGHCQAFISIHSAHALSEAFCPVCVEMPLEFCGSFNNIPEFQFAEA
jgi:hypothetical protein